MAIGAALAVQHLRGSAARRLPWPVSLTHGALGTAALALLIRALWRGLPPSAMGTAGFGPAAAVLLGLALVLGLAIACGAGRRRRPAGVLPAGVLVATHAGLAVAGFVVLWTLIGLG